MSNTMLEVSDFLVSLGLRKQGQRGRLSKESIEAIDNAVSNGLRFSNWDTESKRVLKPRDEEKVARLERKRSRDRSPLSASKASHWTKVREETKMVIVCDDGIEVTLDTHFGCSRPIFACQCKKLSAPAWCGESVFELVA